jgi:zinc protease
LKDPENTTAWSPGMKQLIATFCLTLFLIISSLTPILAEDRSPSGISHMVLSNGLTIITEEIKESSLVSINVYVKAGSKDEIQHTEGITHFVEHLFFRGTSSATGTEFKSSLESLGGICNAETTKDYTRYYINIPSRHIVKGLQLMIEGLMSARYDEREIEQERKVVLEEFKMTRENPSHIFQDLLCEMAYGDHPYKKPIIGTEKTIKSLKRNDFLEFRRRSYTPENLIFVVVGSFNGEKVTTSIAEAFKDIPRGQSIESAGMEIKKPAEVKEKTLEKPVEDIYLVMGFYGPSIKERNTIHATDVLCFMVGTGESSLLSRDLVEKKDILKEVEISFLTQKDPGLITLYAVLKTKDAQMARKEILSALERFASGEFSEDDMKRAKNLLINSTIFGAETNEGKASNLGFYEAIDSYEFAKDYTAKIANVTKEDLIRAAKMYFSPPYCALTIKPQPKKPKFDEDQ